ncbi:UDP-glucose/GDP-mannose dehydrogenase family protein [Listeria aquatica]|uniref:UDP-glucose 6-dehydrogenase n=1 Tax=Listeria aquatica TaxID=1494960 RepID=A0A841ZNJ7_9LIST|nr:UDP-glucose/GDP-mannose dehydrogenase family protein [Listeria aquatica]MBC1520281.1 UDP-glucose/GDP-mannose dehydrogenase family protein [Listeria aquatica]
MKIAVIGVGYVGLVTGVGLATIGHQVTCVDVDENKVAQLNEGISPIYEPGIEKLMIENINENKLSFTTSYEKAIAGVDVVYLAVGTPEGDQGQAELKYLKLAAKQVAECVTNPITLVVKSTVPVGTNREVQNEIQSLTSHSISIVSNPEFLREGTAVYDIFHGDRIVLGSEDKEALKKLTEINEGFGIPILITGLESAEMIKYASNAFLATKISFINELANICEATGGDIREVSRGMGMDRRIGAAFLQAGIGYGGSCFPKDTAALLQISKKVDIPFEMLQEVIHINQRQRDRFLDKLRSELKILTGKKIAVLGLAFKPDTDDIREAPAIYIIQELLKEGAVVTAFDPIANNNGIKQFGQMVTFTDSPEEAFLEADAALIVTEWDEIVQTAPNQFKKLMKQPVVIDGRNSFDEKAMERAGVNYMNVGIGEIKELVLE